jgi:hypothetical protein
MNIFLIGKYENPTTDTISAVKSSFADFSAVGTWIDDGSRCDTCSWHGQSLRQPLLVEWGGKAIRSVIFLGMGRLGISV